MTENKNQNIIYLDANNSYGYAVSNHLPTIESKWIDSKKFHLNKYSSSSSKDCVLDVYLKYPKELHQLHNDYPLDPDKIEIKNKMSKYQVMIADLYNIPIGNINNLVLKSFDKEMYVLHYQNLELYLRL